MLFFVYPPLAGRQAKTKTQPSFGRLVYHIKSNKNQHAQFVAINWASMTETEAAIETERERGREGESGERNDKSYGMRRGHNIITVAE